MPPDDPTPPTRVERDALGELAIPADALYGIHTARAVANLAFSGRPLGGCPAYVWALAAVKRAAARANVEAGVLAPELGAAIERAAAALQAREHAEHLRADLLGGGGSIGVHMNVNEVIANLASEALGGRRGAYDPVAARHVGASQSTADVCHTALRVAILREAPRLSAALAATAAALRAQARANEAVETLARTCLRDAGPVSIAVLFAGHAAAIERRRAEIDRAVATFHAVALGATVIGTGAGAPARYRERVVPLLGELTGLPLTARSEPPDAMQNGDDLGACSAQLRLLAETLIKIAQDVRLLGSGPRGGFGEIELPAVQEGSSFFPGKQNPVVPETVLQCAFQVLGCDRAVQAALEHAELYLNVYDGLAGLNVLDAVRMLARALALFAERCLAGVAVNADRCRELAATSE